MKKISYYARRLELVINSRVALERDSLLDNIGKVTDLLRDYKKFEGKSSYNPLLTEAIETFISHIF